MEASSHGLAQNRLDGVEFAARGHHEFDARPSRLSSRFRRIRLREAQALRRSAAARQPCRHRRRFRYRRRSARARLGARASRHQCRPRGQRYRPHRACARRNGPAARHRLSRPALHGVAAARGTLSGVERARGGGARDRHGRKARGGLRRSCASQRCAGPASSLWRARRAARRFTSITPTRPMRFSRCSTPCARMCADDCMWCSVAEATATAGSVRRWAALP